MTGLDLFKYNNLASRWKDVADDLATTRVFWGHPGDPRGPGRKLGAHRGRRGSAYFYFLFLH